MFVSCCVCCHAFHFLGEMPKQGVVGFLCLLSFRRETAVTWSTWSAKIFQSFQCHLSNALGSWSVRAVSDLCQLKSACADFQLGIHCAEADKESSATCILLQGYTQGILHEGPLRLPDCFTQAPSHHVNFFPITNICDISRTVIGLGMLQHGHPLSMRRTKSFHFWQ